MSEDTIFKLEELKVLPQKELFSRIGKLLILFQNDKEAIAMLKGKVEQAKEQLQRKSDESFEVQRNYEALSALKFTDKKMLDVLNQDKDDLLLKINQCEKIIKTKDLEISDLNSKINNSHEEINLLMKNNTKLKAESASSTKEIKSLNELLTKSESLRRSLENELKEIKQNQASEIAENIKSKNEEIDKLKNDVIQLNQERESNRNKMSTECLSLSTVVSKQNTEYNKALEQITQQIRTIAQLKKKNNDLQIAHDKEKKTYEDTISDLKKNLEYGHYIGI